MPFSRTIFRDKSAQEAHFMLFGAIGDLYHSLTFIRPLLVREAGKNRVLTTYTYDRYGPSAISELVEAYGEIDCLYQCDGGRDMVGLERPPVSAGVIFYRPGITHPLHNDMVTDEFPVEWLRKENMLNMTLLPTYEKMEVLGPRYGLKQPYAICQMSTSGKQDVAADDVRDFVLRLGDEYMFVEMFDEPCIDGALYVGAPNQYDALSIIKHARLYIGVESSQFMAATIMRIPAFYQPSVHSLKHFADDLPIEKYMHSIGRQ